MTRPSTNNGQYNQIGLQSAGYDHQIIIMRSYGRYWAQPYRFKDQKRISEKLMITRYEDMTIQQAETNTIKIPFGSLSAGYEPLNHYYEI
jgi:hypothetical protein